MVGVEEALVLFYDQLWFSRGFLTVSTGWVEKDTFQARDYIIGKDSILEVI